MDIAMLHGGPGASCEYLTPLVEMLAEHGDVHALDQKAQTVNGLVDELENLRLSRELERWWMVGHSWGASLALAYAARLPDRVEGLVLLSGTGITLGWIEEYRREADTDRHPPIDIKSNRALNASWSKEIASPVLRERLTGFRGPVLLVHGARDPRPAWPSEALLDVFPDARLELLSDAGHYPWRDDPGALKRHLDSFLPSTPR